MKKTTKWLTLVLSLILTTNSAVVYGAGDAPLPATTEETATIVADDEATLEPEVGEEIVEWREEGVRHYYLGDGVYQAFVSIDDPGVSTRATSPNSNAAEDTYISSATAATKGTNYGSSDQLWVSTVQTSYIYCPLPYLPDNATITDARLHFKYYYNISTGSLTLSAYPVNFRWREASLTWNIANNYANLGMGTTATGSATLSGTTSVTSKNINITSAVRSWYETQEITSFGIALKRTGGSNQSVILKSSESSSSYRPYMVITYGLSDLPVENGIYYIRNGQHASFFACPLDVGGKYYGQMMAYGANSKQRWEFEYLHNGYYIIRNTSENRVLSVASGKENVSAYLVRETFSGDTRQQWKITQTPNGTYKIKPRSSEDYASDWVMIATMSDYEGEVRQAVYSADSNFSDEWFIQATDAEPLISLPTKILIDQSLVGKESELRSKYQQAVEPFRVLFGIEFQTPTVYYASELNLSTQCHTYSDNTLVCSDKPDECGSKDVCATLHHKSLQRLNLLCSTDNAYTCRMVGYATCATVSGTHRPMGGVGTKQGKDITVTTKEEGYGLSIQHELTHNLGKLSENEGCTPNQSCVMSNDSSVWCDSCRNTINSYINKILGDLPN